MLNDFPPVNSEQSGPLELTFSIVEAPEHGEVPLSALVNDECKIEVTSESKDGMESMNSDGDSTSESSPLITEFS